MLLYNVKGMKRLLLAPYLLWSLMKVPVVYFAAETLGLQSWKDRE